MSDLPSDIETGSIHRDASSPNADRPRGKPGQRDLTTGHIGRTLLAFALPTLGSNILQSLNGSINAIWVGRFLGEDALAATSNANIVMFLLTAFVFGFSMATTILVGQRFGAGDVQLLPPMMASYAARRSRWLQTGRASWCDSPSCVNM